MSIATRITNMETNISNAYTSINNLGVDLSNVDKNLENLSTKINAIYQSYPKVTATGETISLNDTKYARMDTVVKGNSEQVQYSGENLLNVKDVNGTKSSLTFSFLEQIGTIKINGDKYGTGIIKFVDNPITISETGNYSILVKHFAGTVTYPDEQAITVPRICLFNDSGGSSYDGTLIGYAKNEDTQTTVNLTTGTYYFGLLCWVDHVVFNNFEMGVDLVKGSTVPTTFERYTYGQAPNPNFEVPITNVTGDVEVLVQNKNLFDVTEFEENIVENRIINDSGVVVVDNTSEYSTYKISVKANEQLHISGWFQRVYLFDTNDNFISRTINYDGSSTTEKPSFNYTPTVDGYIEFQINISHYNDRKGEEQVEQGSTATTYTAHQEQTFTFPLGTQRMFLGDYLADDGIHHVKKQITFDGTETWYDAGGNVNRSVFYVTDSKISSIENYTNQSSIPNLLSSHFIPTSQKITWKPGDISRVTVSKYIYLIVEPNLTLEQFKTWLSNNNVTVEFVLETEEITPYTTEQQTAYNQIKQAFSYNEQTNVSGTSDELNPIFTVVALKNI